jgi:Tfp pilus assembly protein PilP
MNKIFYIIIYLFLTFNVKAISEETYVDPFNKDIPSLVSKRTDYNALYYPIKSLKLIATLSDNSSTSDPTFLPLAIFLTPSNDQMIVAKGQEIGREKALIVRINKNDIVIDMDDEKITLKVIN